MAERWPEQLLARPPIFVPRPAAPDAATLGRTRQILDGVFTAVGETYALPAGFSWKFNPSRDKEWLIAHHKFYSALDLAQAYEVTREPAFARCWGELVGSWLDEMGTGFITASDAQVEAKRLEHWIVSLSILIPADGLRYVADRVIANLVERIGEEAAYILDHLRPARNHRTFQLYAVFLAGVFLPELEASADWRARAGELLTANLLNDFPADGVHIELSSHYHQITLETAFAYVATAQNNGLPVADALLQRLRTALEFSLWLTLPDGEIPLIGDADNGDHLALLAQGARLFGDDRLLWGASRGHAGSPPDKASRAFDTSGYVVMRNAWGRDAATFGRCQHVFYDCATLGEGSHAHYDLFSFCYAVGGRQLVVDPGRYTYDAEPDADGIDWRYEFKRTAAHNTIAIDHRDQTRYLSKAKKPAHGLAKLDRTQHVGKHGPAVRVVDRAQGLGARSDWVLATASSAEYAPLHTRLFVYMAREYLFILDRIHCDDDGNHQAVHHLHLAAEWQGAVSGVRDEGNFVARGSGWQIRLSPPPASDVALTSGWVAKSYGSKVPAPVIRTACDWLGEAVFATVVGPDDAAFRIDALRREDDAAGNIVFQVDGLREGRTFIDRFALAPDAAGNIAIEQWGTSERFAAWRRESGNVTHVVAAQSAHLVRPRDGTAESVSGGHFEWSARPAI